MVLPLVDEHKPKCYLCHEGFENIEKLRDHQKTDHKDFFDFDEKKYLLDFNNKFYYAGYLEDQQITLDIMQEFLKKHTEDFDNLANEHIKKMTNSNNVQLKGEDNGV